jgi:hypothetical protein
MSDYEFDIVKFRIDYPAFSDIVLFPDDMLQGFYDSATCYISDCNYGYLRNGCRYKAITLMTAHLAQLSVIIANKQVPGIVQSAAISAINVSLTPPPIPNQFQWWLNTTAYGQMLLALLQIKSVGGIYIGGSPERSAFRSFRGRF